VKMSHDKCRGSRFITYYRGLPLHGSPLVLVHPQLLCQAMLRCPHPFGKGRGVSGCNLASEEAKVMMIEPTSLNRGEGLMARSTDSSSFFACFSPPFIVVVFIFPCHHHCCCHHCCCAVSAAAAIFTVASNPCCHC